MKTNLSFQQSRERGSGLLVTIVMTAIALATLATAVAWSSTTTRLNERANQYTRSVAAAEGTTEAVVARITRDFRYGGHKLVLDNQSTYQNFVLNSTHSGGWAGWEFNDANGNRGRTYVSVGSFSNYLDLDAAYAGLKGYICPVSVVSNARLSNSVQNVVAGVRQSLQLANIPIFQFAMFSSGDMEISCGQPLRVTGKVHSNKMLYIEPDSDLTFESDVTAVNEIINARHPLDTRVSPWGSVTYIVPKREHVPSLTLPIGMDNSPAAVREIIELPDAGEDINSPIGRQRYHNQADIIITVMANGTIMAKTGIPISNSRTFPTLHTSQFLSIAPSFTDAREDKLVRPLDIDIGKFRTWAITNQTAFGGRYPSSIYVVDQRVLPTTELAAVRVRNGQRLPPAGLTVATARPLYVLGHYNQNVSANYGTANTSTTFPASLVADAITILSVNWLDTLSSLPVASRVALPTTVNAAFLTGVVETTQGRYSGGMENFPRFLETWGELAIFTYNGSMVKMFPSQYATAPWGMDDVYDPPARNWAFDLNFNNPAKLPPLTPCLQRVIRGQWTTIAPNQTTSTPVSL
jgi:hypothetical protein